MGIESLLPEWIKVPIIAVVGGLMVATQLAPRFPQVEWLQKLRRLDKRTEEQKARDQRRANIITGLEMIVAAVALPFGYLVLTLITWGDPSRNAMIVVGAFSIFLLGLGIRTIVRSRL